MTLFDLSGRSALVTGASGALGGAAVRALSDAGARVTVAAGNAARLEAVPADSRIARRPESPDDAEAIVEAAGELDVVVLASGMNVVAPTVDMADADFQAVMDANVRGSWLVCQAAGRRMIEQGRGGKIVLVSSTRGRLGHPAGYSAYCASKSAVEGLTRALACEWGPHGINVNAIGPTVFRSDLTAWMYADDGTGRAVREAMLARIPLGRLGEPDDFAGTLVYLAARASDFMTGQVLYVDGGYTAG